MYNSLLLNIQCTGEVSSIQVVARGPRILDRQTRQEQTNPQFPIIPKLEHKTIQKYTNFLFQSFNVEHACHCLQLRRKKYTLS